MSREKLDMARQLIIERHFQAARELLKTIDDPKAQQWLAKLEQVQPVEKKRSPIRKYALIGGLYGLLCLLLGIAIGFALFSQKQTGPQLVAAEPTRTTMSHSTAMVTETPLPAPSRTATPTRTQLPTATASSSTEECWKDEW